MPLKRVTRTIRPLRKLVRRAQRYYGVGGRYGKRGMARRVEKGRKRIDVAAAKAKRFSAMPELVEAQRIIKRKALQVGVASLHKKHLARRGGTGLVITGGVAGSALALSRPKSSRGRRK